MPLSLCPEHRGEPSTKPRGRRTTPHDTAMACPGPHDDDLAQIREFLAQNPMAIKIIAAQRMCADGFVLVVLAACGLLWLLYHRIAAVLNPSRPGGMRGGRRQGPGSAVPKRGAASHDSGFASAIQIEPRRKVIIDPEDESNLRVFVRTSSPAGRFTARKVQNLQEIA